MAKINVTTQQVTIQTAILSLTEEEARTLYALTDRIGGCTSTSRRAHIKSIRDLLTSLFSVSDEDVDSWLGDGPGLTFSNNSLPESER